MQIYLDRQYYAHKMPPAINCLFVLIFGPEIQQIISLAWKKEPIVLLTLPIFLVKCKIHCGLVLHSSSAERHLN
jgi:hypothetical protein